jgi:hypothetical protein
MRRAASVLSVGSFTPLPFSFLQYPSNRRRLPISFLLVCLFSFLFFLLRNALG